MTEMQLPTVGFVGLGAMGLPMAQSLLRAGMTVRGYDVRAEAVQTLVESGGAGAESAGETATGADVIVVVVLNAAQVDAVLFGQGGVAATARPGAIVLVCSTVSPEFARETGQKLADLGLIMLDSPISGGTTGASTGTLSIMASGPRICLRRRATGARGHGQEHL